MYAMPLPGYLGMLLTVLVLVLFLLPLLVLSVLAYEDMPERQQLSRRHLSGRLSGTRMWDMLVRHGISPAAYLRSTTPAVVRDQIRTCHDCRNKQMCDTALRYLGTGHTSYDFCPNRATFAHLIKE